MVDSREQLPYEFAGIPTVGGSLKTGDYSLEGLEGRVAVERKSKVDAYGCVGKGRQRFIRCLRRLAAMDRAAVVIEADLHDFAQPPSYTRINAASAVGSYVSWGVQFDIPIIWAGNRAYAERVTVRFLEAFEKYCAEEKGP